MKYVFSVPVRIVVDAETAVAAREAIEVIEGGTVVAPGFAAQCESLLFDGEPEQLRACVVCGCTDDDACEEGCSWIAEELCSTEDDAHLSARSRLGVEEDGVPLVFEVAP